MKRCKTCKHWYTRQREWAYEQQDAQRECGWMLLHESDKTSDGVYALDEDGFNRVYTGPDFGCVHCEGIASQAIATFLTTERERIAALEIERSQRPPARHIPLSEPAGLLRVCYVSDVQRQLCGATPAARGGKSDED